MKAIFLRTWAIVEEVARRWGDNDGGSLAASLAYYAALSFFPLVLVLISGLGLALSLSADARESQQQLLDLVAARVSPVLADSVRGILSDVRGGAGISGPVGLGIALVGAIGVFAQLDAAVNRFWRGAIVRPSGVLVVIRRVLMDRVRAFALLLALGVLVVASFFGGVALDAARAIAPEFPGAQFGWQAIQVLVGIATNVVVFTLLYKVMPQAKVAWRHAFACACGVALAWELARQLVAALVIRGNYSAYGVVGSFIVMMVWVYFASALVLFGAQFVQTLGHPPRSADQSA